MFGHRRGSFTDARENSLGVIRSGAGGTLILDEVGSLDPVTQPKLLRFLESSEIQPIREPRPITAKVRVIAATNVILDILVGAGRLREDLYYLLDVVCLQLPPLRERREEIPALIHHFLRRYGNEMNRNNVKLSPEAQSCLLVYD